MTGLPPVPFLAGRSRALLAAAAFGLAAVVIYYAVISDSPLPDHRRFSGGHNDLILHAGAFAALTTVTVPALRRPAVALAGLVAFAMVLEAAQLGLPARTASWIDLAASLSGIGLGWVALSAGRTLYAFLFAAAPHTRTIMPADAGTHDTARAGTANDG